MANAAGSVEQNTILGGLKKQYSRSMEIIDLGYLLNAVERKKSNHFAGTYHCLRAEGEIRSGL